MDAKDDMSSTNIGKSSLSLYESALKEANDHDLILRFRNGDERSFRILTERYQEKVRNLIYSMMNDADSADDLSQEIFIRVYQALPKFRFESSFYTWLYRIAINRIRDEIRRKKVKKIFSFRLNASDETERNAEKYLAVQPADSSMSEVIQLGLQKVPEIFRTPVILKDIEGFSYEEMSRIMQCEMGTVKSRLARGRALLKKELTPLLAE